MTMESVEAPRVHVAFVVNNYPPHVGGVERHVQSLARGLLSAGVRVTVVALAGKENCEADEAGVHVLRRRQWLAVAGVLAFPKPGETRRLAAILADAGATVVSTHTRYFPMSFIGARLGVRLKVPVLHTEHGSGFVRGVSPPIALASRIVDLTLGRYVLRSARRVLAVSEQVRSFVRKLAHREASLFFNAVDIEAWRSPATTPRRFVFVGRIVEGKGWDVVLDGFAALRSAGRIPAAFRCEFYGDGPQLQRLRDSANSLGLSGTVTIAGSVSQEQLAEALRGSILVNPTTLAEGFQTSLLEVVASGSQVVTYDVPGARYLADDGAPVLIVEREDSKALIDAMARAANDPAPAYSSTSLAKWDWRLRAQEYLDHLSAANSS